MGGTDSGNQAFVIEFDGAVAPFWFNISLDGLNNGPHTGIQTMTLDASGRLVVGTDGGVWRYTPAVGGLPTVGTWLAKWR